jgi:diguanylate cyclase (GGDEF)-like protein/PAS domain S-box-containing protein
MTKIAGPDCLLDGDRTLPVEILEAGEHLTKAELTAMLVRLFEFAPIAMSITTSDTRTSSYVKVNDAYLQLIGRSWEDIRGKQLIDAAAIDNPARDRRHQLLLENGSYELEEVDISHADGTVIPTLISAQRTMIGDVSYDVEVILDVSSRVRQQQEIENALIASARTDALSGLPNRAAFDITLSEMVGRNLGGSRKLAIAYIDLNGFKAINDTLGHDAGDHVLKTVAARLRQNFRATDFIARIGGDEFAVLLEMDRNFASGIYTHISDAMQKVFKPISVDGQVTKAGAAVGATFLSHDDTLQSYIKRADRYMYQAKATRERIAVVCSA